MVDITNDDIGESNRLALWEMMLKLRLVEKKAYDLFLQNLIKGTSHLALGQEAIAGAFGVSLQEGDYTFCTYRGHAHTLARGSSIEGVLGELMGRQCGLMKGKGGSMHLTDVDKGVMGSYAIIGAHLTIANGTALASKYNKTKEVSVCFFGDGTTNIGAFHEALNMAQIWKLPIVFVCENNLYMEYTPIGDEMYRTAQAAIKKARDGDGPSLIEAKTYRHSGHSRADPGKYRPDEEVKDWMENKDPITNYRKRLLEFNIDEKIISEIENKVKEQVEEATEISKASPIPDVKEIYTDVWADGGYKWHN
jgi:pyruvate dehydrogenase E1 component alpha subunit